MTTPDIPVPRRAGAWVAWWPKASPCKKSQAKMRHVEKQAAGGRFPHGMKQGENLRLKRYIGVLHRSHHRHAPCALSISRSFTPNKKYSPVFSCPRRHPSLQCARLHVCRRHLLEDGSITGAEKSSESRTDATRRANCAFSCHSSFVHQASLAAGEEPGLKRIYLGSTTHACRFSEIPKSDKWYCT